MWRVVALTAVFISLGTSITTAQGLGGFSFPWLNALSEEVEINPFAQVGFMHMRSNLSLPIGAQVDMPGLLQIDTVDISMQRADFWTGAIGFTATYGPLFRLFASAGGILPRQFIVRGRVPISLDGFTDTPIIKGTASNVQSWFIQSGTALGPVLLGMYWGHFANTAEYHLQPYTNETLESDITTSTFAPYVGIAIPATPGAVATVIYSPQAWSHTTMALRTAHQDLAQLQYKWNKPGDFLSATLQYDTPVERSVSFALWANYTWMRMIGAADLEFKNPTSGVFSQGTVTARVTQYVIQGGIKLGVSF